MKNSTDKTYIDQSAEVRSMIDKENDMIHYRITWLTTLQGLLFAALGFVWGQTTGTPLIKLLSSLGIVFSIIIFVALIAATNAMNRLIDWWDENKPDDYNGPGVVGLHPPENKIGRNIGFYLWVPVVFIVAWGIVWVIILKQ